MTPLTLSEIRDTIIDATNDMRAALLRDLDWMIADGYAVVLPTPSEPCLHHDLRGNPAHVPGCSQITKPTMFCDYCGGTDHTDEEHEE